MGWAGMARGGSWVPVQVVLSPAPNAATPEGPLGVTAGIAEGLITNKGKVQVKDLWSGRSFTEKKKFRSAHIVEQHL